MGERGRKGLVLTKRVNPDWYRRYAKVLNYDDRVFIQPLREIREEEALLRAMRTPPNEDERAIELSKKLDETRARKIKLVLQILEGNMRNLDLSFLKTPEPTITNFSLDHEGKQQVLFWRNRAVRPPNFVLSPNSKWRLFWEDKEFVKKFHVLIEEKQRRKVRGKWKKAVRQLQMIQHFTNVINDIGHTTDDVFKKLIESLNTEGPLSFQKNHFKRTSVAKKVDVQTLFTLSKPEMYRTEENITNAAIVLRVISSFAEFPPDLQKKICRIGWYLELNKDKTIIREGQPATSFYFVLSGKVAAVKISCSTTKSGTSFKVVKIHHTGSIVGEEVVGSCEYRQYTLCTIEKCKLIAINIDDFNRACLEGQTEHQSPKHIAFLSQLSFMKFFPMRQLVENAEGNIKLFYYKKGSLVTEDIADSDFIYVVYKGNCKVLTPLVKRIKLAEKFHLPPIDSHDEHLTPLSSSTSVSKKASLSRESLMKLKVTPSTYGSIQARLTRTSILMDNLTRMWGKKTMAYSIRRVEGVSVNMQLVNAGRVEMLLRSKHEFETEYEQWILLKMLREGDVIGLETLDLGEIDKPTPVHIAVVSDGALIVLLSKKYFMNHASEMMKMDLRASSYLFPSENQIREEMERRRLWMKFQSQVLKEDFENKH